jgi:urease accessory protein
VRSRVTFAVKAVHGVTRRARVHEDGSLRVRCPGAPSEELEAVIVNTAGGMAGGDEFSIDVSAGAGAKLVVTSAAAEKVYRTLGPDTAVTLSLAVEAGASLSWLPQETILFDRARLRRNVDIELAADARLVFAEAVVFGRAGMGEIVGEGALSDRWRVRRDGRLIYAESARLDGAISQTLAQCAVTNGGVAVATVLAVPGGDELVAAVRALGENFRGEVGASAWNGLAAVRLCAKDGMTLRRDLVSVLTAVRGIAPPRLWLN